ncbi:hypothetical protein SRRS_32390 [Sporomusa rhizae]|uniref:hypothetical protein n=1 Tax=Sporomusa rhizae TaxID=357999 RepID=UPI00352BBD52
MSKKFQLTTVAVIIFSLLLTPIALAAESAKTDAAPVISSVVPGNVYIPKGTILHAELMTGVNSGKNNLGDKAMFKVTENLVVNSVVVIPKGTTGEAIVTKVKRAGSWGKGGGIELEANRIKTLNNIEVPLTLDTKKYGGGHGMVVPWLAIGIFSGFLRGKNQDIPVGTKFTVAVDADVDLGATSETLAESMKNTVVVTTTTEG